VTNASAVPADRFRGITYRNGKPLVLRNDGTTVATQ